MKWYHNVFLKNIDEYDQFEAVWPKDDNAWEGITRFFGIKEGKKDLVRIEFSTYLFTKQGVDDWLKKNNHKAIIIEYGEDRKMDSKFFDGKEFETLELCDRSVLPKATITKEGFIRADAAVTRIGIFVYRGQDGKPIKILRLPEDVFDQKSLDTMKMIPVTKNHPSKFVDAANAKSLIIGATGENITHDDMYVYSPLVVNTADGVSSVKAGKKELSLGYYADTYMTPGVWQGQAYDGIMKNLRYNHLAIVDSARAGKAARLYIDSVDVLNNHKSEGGSMPTINLDGIAYEAAQEVINKLTGLQKDNADLKINLDPTKTDLEKTKGIADEKTKKVEELEKVESFPQKIGDAVNSRLDLLGKVVKLFDEKEIAASFNDKSDKDIKIAAIKKIHSDFNEEGKTDGYIDGRFDVAIEGNKSNNNDGTQNQRKQFGDANNNNNRQVVDSDKSRKNMIGRMTDASKPKEDK